MDVYFHLLIFMFHLLPDNLNRLYSGFIISKLFVYNGFHQKMKYKTVMPNFGLILPGILFLIRFEAID